MIESSSWQTILLVLAIVQFGLAALKIPDLPRWSWGWGGAFALACVLV